jgi:hypothetical protein
MKQKSILAVGFVLLMALSIVGSACPWCWGVPGPVGGTDKAAGVPIVFNGPDAPTGVTTWTYQWTIWYYDSTGIHSRLPTTAELTNGGKTMTVTPALANCGNEFGAVLTVTESRGGAACNLVRCAWYNIVCGNCPSIASFCQGLATSGPTGESGSPFSYTYNLVGPGYPTPGSAFVPSVTNLNGLAPGSYTLTATIAPSGKVCAGVPFDVYAKPTGTISVT